MKNLLYIILVLLLSLLTFVLYQNYNKVSKERKFSNSNINLTEKIISETTTKSGKVASLKVLKDMSLDVNLPDKNRVLAGTAVVSTFFSNGMDLREGFSNEKFTERDIYEYAKKVNNINSGYSSLLPLHISYIGLRFYPEEYSKKDVLNLLEISNSASKNDASLNVCRNQSKVSSIIYLASKSKNTDITAEYGNYYSSFEKVFNTLCQDFEKNSVAFMWLAAISDFSKSEKEDKKAEELIKYMKDNRIPNDNLSRNLKYSYFVEDKEPDTESIVERISIKYPAFKDVLKDMENSISGN